MAFFLRGKPGLHREGACRVIYDTPNSSLVNRAQALRAWRSWIMVIIILVVNGLGLFRNIDLAYTCSHCRAH